jgi:hypothetical protein
MIRINLMSKNCNCKRFKGDKLAYCNRKGRWQHPRYSGVFCDECKETVSNFFKDGWTLVKKN